MAVSPNDVSNLVTSEKNLNLTCFHLNIRSARNKDDELSIFLNEFAFEFDVIILTETWYTNDFEVYKRDGYETFFLNRSNKRGGGVAILIKNNLSCDIIPVFFLISRHRMFNINNPKPRFCCYVQTTRFQRKCFL